MMKLQNILNEFYRGKSSPTWKYQGKVKKMVLKRRNVVLGLFEQTQYLL